MVVEILGQCISRGAQIDINVAKCESVHTDLSPIVMGFTATGMGPWRMSIGQDGKSRQRANLDPRMNRQSLKIGASNGEGESWVCPGLGVGRAVSVSAAAKCQVGRFLGKERRVNVLIFPDLPSKRIGGLRFDESHSILP